MHLRGIRALAAVSGADMTIGVMCALRGAQTTQKGLHSWDCRRCADKDLRNASRLIFNKNPPDMGPLDISLPLNLISGQKPSRVGRFDQ